jgi:hypothetical protein
MTVFDQGRQSVAQFNFQLFVNVSVNYAIMDGECATDIPLREELTAQNFCSAICRATPPSI